MPETPKKKALPRAGSNSVRSEKVFWKSTNLQFLSSPQVLPSQTESPKEVRKYAVAFRSNYRDLRRDSAVGRGRLSTLCLL